MGIASLVMGVVALILGMMGFIPVIGVVSLLAPILSLFGSVLGGVGISRARQEGVSSGLAVGGLVVNIVAFVITLPIALTCGACNACFAGGAMMGGRDGGIRWERADGGSYILQGGSGAPPFAPGGPMAPPIAPPPGAPAPMWPPPPMPPTGAPPTVDPSTAPPVAPPVAPPIAPPGAPSPAAPSPDPSAPTGSVAPVAEPPPDSRSASRSRRSAGRARGDAVGPESAAVGPESAVRRAAARALGPQRADPATAAGF